MLWKVVRHSSANRYLVGVLEADDEESAKRLELARHDELRANFETVLEPAADVHQAPLSIQVHDSLKLDAGRLASFRDAGVRRRAVLPPQTGLMEQVVSHLEKAKPQSTLPSMAQQGRAVAKLAFRWGTYFALIGDTHRPQSAAAGSHCGYWNDSEQARMNIEVSANLERLYRFMEEDPARWYRIVNASRQLPDLPATDQSAVPSLLIARLRHGVVEGHLDYARRLHSVVGGKPLVASELENLLSAENKPEVRAAFEANPVRRITNHFALATLRNRLENFHGHQPGARDFPADVVLTLDHNRFTTDEHREIEAIMAQAGSGFMQLRSVLRGLAPDEVRKRAAFPTTMDEAGRKWSIVEKTRPALL